MMKLVICSKVPVFPVFGGNRSRIKTFCDEARRQGFEIHFVLLPAKDRGEYDADQHKNYFGNGSFWELRRHPVYSAPYLVSTLVRREINRVAYHLGRARRLVKNIDYQYDNYLEQPLRNILSEIEPDILIIEYVHFSKISLLAPSGCMTVIDTHDSFGHEFTPEAEGLGLRRAKRIIAIQLNEAERFRHIASNGPDIHLVSHIVPKIDVVNTDKCDGFSFVGSSFDANNVSLMWLFGEVLPIVIRQRPACRLFVAGDVCNAIPDDNGVVKMGRIENLKEIYARAPIMANAIRKGTGIKIKLLEALASGVPVVSTQLGVAGIDSRYLHGVTVVDDSDAEGFAARIIELFDDEKRRRDLGRQGVEDMLLWNVEQNRALKDVLSLG